MQVASKIAMGAAAIDGRSRFDPEVRRQYMNASEAESCLRRQWYEKNMPEEGEEQSWGYARRGHKCEEYLVEALKAANVDIRLTGDEQKSIKEGPISATPDGVIVDHEAERLIVVEFKSIDPRRNRKDLPTRNHETQIGLAMCLIDTQVPELGLPDWPISHGVIVYMNASNFDDVIEKRVMYEPTLIDQLKPRAEKLLNGRSVNAFQREGKVKGGAECKYCAFSSICLDGSDVEQGSTVTGRGNRGSRLDNSIKAYWAAKLDEDDAKAKKAAEAERIKEELKSRKINHIEVAGREVKLTQVAGRKTLDKKALAEAGVKIEDYEKVGKPSERLTIT